MRIKTLLTRPNHQIIRNNCIIMTREFTPYMCFIFSIGFFLCEHFIWHRLIKVIEPLLRLWIILIVSLYLIKKVRYTAVISRK